MAGNPLASLPGLPQRPSLARSSASETRLTQPGIEPARSRKLNSAPTAAFRLKSLAPVRPNVDKRAYTFSVCYYCCMTMTVTEFARKGGHARAAQLSAEELSAIGKKGGRPRRTRKVDKKPK